MGGKKCASLTVEAALCLSLFFFAVILLSVPMEILDTQRRVQMVLETAARELCWQAYPLYRLSQNDTSIELPEEMELLAGTALAVYLGEKVKAAGGGRLERVNCLGSRVSADGEIIDLRAAYEMKLPFSVFALDRVSLSSRSYKRGWIGAEGNYFADGGKLEEEETIVYVGKGSTRYHLSPNCHYISNQITAVAYEQVGSRTNREGKHYKACSVCGAAAGTGGLAYILPGGEYYHSRQDCSSLAYYVQAVPLSEVAHLGACSYCGGGK